MRSLFILLSVVALAAFELAEAGATGEAAAAAEPYICNFPDCSIPKQPVFDKGRPLNLADPAQNSRREDKPIHTTEEIYPFTVGDGRVEAKGGARGGGGAKGGAGGGAGAHSAANSKSLGNPFAVLRGPILFLNSVYATSRAQAVQGDKGVEARDAGFVAPVGVETRATESDDGETAKFGVPETRRDGCDAILGFDCGSASKVEAGPVGKLVKWTKSA